MGLVLYLSVSFLFLVVMLYAALILSWRLRFINYQPNNIKEYPFISVLVAVRNEESNIKRCLDSLLAQEYPKDQLEILVGDDSSEDNSLKILREYENVHSTVKVFSINENIGNTKGKANVLAQLAKNANGEYYLITDADIELTGSWINGMLDGLTQKTGTIIGFTRVEDNPWQNLDWMLALGMIKVITDLGTPVTGVGNNMLVSKAAYQAVGGYESIPFSITEDYELFKQISKKGFDHAHIASPRVLATSRPVKGFYNLLRQRKRWMKGAVQLPLPILLILLFNALYFPLIIIILFIFPPFAIFIGLLKSSLQAIFIYAVSKELTVKPNILYLFLFEFYSLIVTISSCLYFLIPTGVEWKGRKY